MSRANSDFGAPAGILVLLLALAFWGNPLYAADKDKGGQVDSLPIDLNIETIISGNILGYNLQQPHGLALDALGNLFVSDAGNHRIIMFDKNHKAVRDYGGYGSGDGRFIRPEDIVVDRGLNLYVIDTGNRRVVHLDSRLNFVNSFVSEDSPDEIISTDGKLSGIVISDLGEITLADYDNSRLIRLDNFYRFSRYIGDFGYGRGALLNPTDLDRDRDGLIYAADAGNDRIAIYDDFGNYKEAITGEHVTEPQAITVCPDLRIWVGNNDGSLTLFSRDHKEILSIKEIGPDKIQVGAVDALLASRDGRLYIADRNGGRIIVCKILYGE